MTPYRIPAAQPAKSPSPEEPDDDQPVLCWLAIVLGCLRVGIAVLTGEDWGTEASVAGFFLISGLVGLRPVTRGLRSGGA